MRYCTYTANWWSRAESATSTLAKLRRKQVGAKEIAELETCCRRLAMDGVPSAGAAATATAKLHRAVWRDRLSDMSIVGVEVIEGMAMQATEEARKALRYELRRSGQEYARWLADKCDNGTMHRMTKPQLRHEDEMIEDEEMASSTLARLDLKTKAFEKIWSDGQEHHHKHQQLLQ